MKRADLRELDPGVPDGDYLLSVVGGVMALEGYVPPTGGGGGGGSGSLEYKAHNPSTREDYATSSTSVADVDATDLAVTFTVPASGAVAVILAALGGVTASNMLWLLREGTTEVPGSRVQMSTVGNLRLCTGPIIITGLTPDAVLTWKWAWLMGGAGTGRIYAGGNAGQATMDVQAR